MLKNRFWIILLSVFVLIIVIGFAGIFAAENEAGSASDPVVTKSYVDELFSSISGNESASFVFEVVEVPAGSKLIGGAGTEMILRGGKATAIDNGRDGISDLTAGIDLKTGASISMNHLLLVPKEDGRGMQCSLKSWVMVRGEYTIQ